MAGKSLVSQFKSAGNLISVPLSQIHVRPNFNPRTIFDREEMDELKRSIASNGFLTSKALEIYEEKGLWILGDGERRYRAALELEKEGTTFPHGVPCIVVRRKNDLERLTEALIANEHRAPLQPLDEARAFVRLQNFGWSAADIANRLGKSEPFIYNRLSLIEAEKELMEEIKAGEISLNDAIKIIKASRSSDLSQAELRARQKAEAAKKKAEAKATREAARNGTATPIEESVRQKPIEESGDKESVRQKPIEESGDKESVRQKPIEESVAVRQKPSAPAAAPAAPAGHKPSDLDDSFESELLRLGVNADDYTNPVVRIGAELSSIVSANPAENLAIIIHWLADYCGSALAFKLYVDSLLTTPAVPEDSKPLAVKASLDSKKPTLHVPTTLLPAGSARSELAALAASTESVPAPAPAKGKGKGSRK